MQACSEHRGIYRSVVSIQDIQDRSEHRGVYRSVVSIE